jgi:hypothetical protein
LQRKNISAGCKDQLRIATKLTFSSERGRAQAKPWRTSKTNVRCDSQCRVLLGEHIHLVANPTHSASDTRVMNKLSPIERWRAQVDRLRSGVGLIYPGKSDKCQ